MVIYFVIVMWYFQVMVSCGKVSNKTTLSAVDFLPKSECRDALTSPVPCLLLPCRWDASHSPDGAADGAEAEPAAVRPLQGPSSAECSQPAHAAAPAAGAPAARQRPHGADPGHPAAPAAAAVPARGTSGPAADPGEDPAPERAPDGRSASSAAAAAGAPSNPRARTGAQPSVAAASYNTATGTGASVGWSCLCFHGH